MVTNRGRWILLLSISGAALGLLRGQELLALTSLALLIWLGMEWVVFRWRAEIAVKRLRFERTVNDSDKPVTLWTGRPAQFRLRIQPTGRLRIPFIRFRDFLPAGLEVTEGSNAADAVLSGSDPFTYEYTATPLGAGRMVLPGLTIQISDLQGLFFCQRMLRKPQSYRVMPTCVNVDAPRPLTKPHNALLPPGIHRFLRPGTGPELLELREYVPGDPPKSIAWKVSARKDCLMTRQYESEVPIRVTLFVDGSAGARVGGFGHRPLDQLIFLAGTLARATMADRDPVRLVQFDDDRFVATKHGAGERHLYRLLNALADFSAASPRRVAFSQDLLAQTWAVCEELFPERLEGRVNRTITSLWPLRPHSRRWRTRRTRLATVLGDLYQLPPDRIVQMVFDDRMMAEYAFRFLSQSGVPWSGRLFDSRGRNRFASTGKLRTVSDALIRSVATGRDNELFVVLVDLIDHAEHPGPLRDAIRVARARHNRVVVICPWPGALRPDSGSAARKHKLEAIAEQAEEFRLQAAADQIRHSMRPLGVPVAFAADPTAVQLVLTQAQLARGGRTSRVSIG